ncbi:MAG: sigma-70 family RNA polymerase sigma factor [Planctomycetaceae bacterium]|nr:sigma-70 family RNA polymerase sigma factor [Planctomycetaceae bacterium]
MSQRMDASLQVYQARTRRDGRDALIIEHLPLVRHVLGRIITTLPAHVDAENLESAGVCGLVEAAGRFDDQRGIAFSTFAYPRIRGAILDELRRNCPFPQHILERWSQIRAALTSEHRTPTSAEISRSTGFTVLEVEECLAAVQLAQPQMLSERQTEPQGDSAVDSPESPLLEAEVIEVLAEAIEQLPEQMRVIVTLYYRNGLRLKEIAEVVELSESRISRVLTAAALRLREIVLQRLA